MQPFCMESTEQVRVLVTYLLSPVWQDVGTALQVNTDNNKVTKS